MTTAILLTLVLACPCDDFAADVARRADLMAADVETMPHVVKEGLRQLAHDAMQRASAVAVAETNLHLCAREAEVTAQDARTLCEKRRAALEKLRAELRKARATPTPSSSSEGAER